MGELWERLKFAINAATVSCRLYRLCEGCAGQVRIPGRGGRYAEPESQNLWLFGRQRDDSAGFGVTGETGFGEG